MVWAAIIIGGIILVALIAVKVGNQSKAIDSGAAVKRNYEFFKQKNFFKTSVASISDIYDAVDVSVLTEQKINIQYDSENKMVIFRNKKLGGTFTAALRFMGEEDGKYVYRFQIEKWEERNGGISADDMLGGNVALTSVEKAVISLDTEATVTRENATYNTKTHF